MKAPGLPEWMPPGPPRKGPALKPPEPRLRTHRQEATLTAQGRLNDQLTVVCFGASAGGFNAYCTILGLLPSDTGMAYVIVHHQPADGKSLLVEILPRMTDMPVILVADRERVKADHVYVVPAGMQVTMDGDEFRIRPIIKSPGWPKNITIFLQSLAEDRRKRAIAVILSGFDSDGAAALKSIKDAGGIVFAQEFRTAEQPDMPHSAVETGCVDRLLQPAEIAFQLERIGEERARFKNAPGNAKAENLSPKGETPISPRLRESEAPHIGRGRGKAGLARKDPGVAGSGLHQQSFGQRGEGPLRKGGGFI
jgi:two-component system chemotaxis response regulator CheB